MQSNALERSLQGALGHLLRDFFRSLVSNNVEHCAKAARQRCFATLLKSHFSMGVLL